MLIFAGVPQGVCIKQGWGGKNKQFSSFMSRYLKNGTKLLLMTNRKLHMHFRLAPRSMTLDHLNLLSANFLGILHYFAFL